MVTDYRALNAITVKDRTMMPNIQELLDQLREAKYFSSLDAHSGYHQIRLQAGDEDKTAITTPFGHYNFTVMPFGLVNAGATYSAMMTDLLREKLYGSVVSYLDDTLVFSKTFREHISTLREVFKVGIQGQQDLPQAIEGRAGSCGDQFFGLDHRRWHGSTGPEQG